MFLCRCTGVSERRSSGAIARAYGEWGRAGTRLALASELSVECEYVLYGIDDELRCDCFHGGDFVFDIRFG